jgi:hypothetical protein
VRNNHIPQKIELSSMLYKFKRYVGTFGAFLLTLLAISLVLLFESRLYMEDTAKVVDAALAQAGIAFALDRALDATISLFSSASVGVGLNVNIGAILDPFDSIIEDFATVLQWAIGSLLLQKLLLNVTFQPVFTYLMWIGAALTLTSMLLKRDALALLFGKAFLSLTLVKFSMVLIIVANSYVDKTFIHHEIESGIAKTQGIETELRKEAEPAADKVSFEQIGFWKQEREKILNEQKSILAQISDNQIKLTELQSQRSTLIRQRDERNNSSTITNRMSSFWRSDDLDQIIDTLSKDIDLLEASTKTLNKRIKQIDEMALHLENQINGKPNGMIESVSQQAKGMVDKALQSVPRIPSLESLQNQLEETASSLVNLMAMFVIKSILMPILFLYLLFLINKLLWRIDFDPKNRLFSRKTVSV